MPTEIIREPVSGELLDAEGSRVFVASGWTLSFGGLELGEGLFSGVRAIPSPDKVLNKLRPFAHSPSQIVGRKDA